MRKVRALPPAILLGGDVNAWGAVQALAGFRVPIVAVSYHPYDVAQYSRHVTRSYRLPPGEPAATRALLARLARTHPGAVVLPTNDDALLAVARGKARLEALGLAVAAPPWEAARAVVDKAETYRLAREAGVPIPQTHFVASEADLDRIKPGLAYPCLVKPHESHAFYARFRRKMFRAGGPAELSRAFARARGAGLGVVVQEFVPGGDDALHGYLLHVGRDGRPRAEAWVRKVRQNPPLLGMASVMRTVEPLPGVREPVLALLARLRWRGYAVAELKRDARDGTFRLMEINGRLCRCTKLDLVSGVNFTRLAYLDAAGRLPPGPAPVARAGVTWAETLVDAYRACFPGDAARPGLRALLAPYRGRRWTCADLALSDPRPTAYRVGIMAAQFARTFARTIAGRMGVRLPRARPVLRQRAGPAP